MGAFFIMKKKILFNTEATYIATGYGRYGHELLKRLHDSGKYEIAELSSYGVSAETAARQGDDRISKIPWKYYPNVPNPDDKRGQDEFNSNPFNQFGKWRWEHTCLDFKPDICCAFRDNWYDNYMLYSPLRRFYKTVWMPTVDAKYQKEEWIADCLNLDACLTYTNWAQKLLKKQSNGKINLIGIAPPCADENLFKQIHNKKQLKASLGLSPNSVIIGTTMRNQKRKLYPQLFKAFARFLKENPKEVTDEVFLYCHTYWPDLGWDIPDLIKEYGISKRVLFSYTCKNPKCRAVFQSLFCDARTNCIKCQEYSAALPNSNHGVDVKDLVVIYNLFDIYVQYSNSEGFGIPIVEAACTGLPVMVVDYSGMEDFKDTIGATPIKVKDLLKEAETGLYRAYPDEDDFVQKLTDLVRMPDMVRRKLGFETKRLYQQNYNWDKTAQAWMNYFDSVETPSNWNSPLKIHRPNLNFPEHLSNDDFVKYCLINILGKPELINSFPYFKLLRNLNWGYNVSNYGSFYLEDTLFGERPNFREYKRQDMVDELLNELEFHTKWEQERVSRIKV